jgi:hypothetical protein
LFIGSRFDKDSGYMEGAAPWSLPRSPQVQVKRADEVLELEFDRGLILISIRPAYGSHVSAVKT